VKRVIALAALLAAAPLAAQTSPQRPFGTLREQAAIQQGWLQYRLDSILPGLMRQNGVDMWLVDCREYNEDPVFFSIVSPTTFACRRRTIYVFYDRGVGRPLERLALGGSSQGGLFEAVRDTAANVQSVAVAGRGGELVGAGQWALLRRTVEQRNPRAIAIDVSQTHAFSDGLSAGEYEQLQQALGPELMARTRRAELLPLAYIAVRPPAMLDTYRRMQELAHDIIRRAFSREVITPGVTRTGDVAWWTRQRLNDLGLGTWFHTDVDVQRRGADPDSLDNAVILPGDVLHIDFGISALGLKTDTQHMGYVLRPGEREPPEGLRRALANSNRLQDIVLAELRSGRTGNDILRAALAAMTAAGITGTVYSHPVGDHGHGAGPLIGLWDHQEGVPGRGDVPVWPDTWFSIELEARTPVPEWNGQVVKSAQEEDAAVGADGVARWVLLRQTAFHLVR
jgi:Xaa-Pro aminopeptidase